MSPNYLKLNCLSVGVFFRSGFAVQVPEATKLFFVIVSETIIGTWKAVN